MDRLPRELEKGWDGEEGRNRGSARWYGVCVGSAASSHGSGQGLHSPRVCAAELNREGGHSWLDPDALTVPASTSSVKSDILAFALPSATQKP